MNWHILQLLTWKSLQLHISGLSLYLHTHSIVICNERLDFWKYYEVIFHKLLHSWSPSQTTLEYFSVSGGRSHDNILFESPMWDLRIVLALITADVLLIKKEYKHFPARNIVFCFYYSGNICVCVHVRICVWWLPCSLSINMWL